MKFTTQLYRDYNKPWNKDPYYPSSIMESRKVFFVAQFGINLAWVLRSKHRQSMYVLFTPLADLNIWSFWSNYSDLIRPHPKWWFSKGNLLFQGNLGWWNIIIWPGSFHLVETTTDRKNVLFLFWGGGGPIVGYLLTDKWVVLGVSVGFHHVVDPP